MEAPDIPKGVSLIPKKEDIPTMKRIFSFSLILALLLSVGALAVPITAAAATPRAAGLVDTGGGRLNVRASPSTGGAWVASLTSGETVTLLEKTGEWWRVEYAAGKTGYCHGAYLTVTSTATATVATGQSTLNVRSGPATSYARIGSLKSGTAVIVLSTSGDFCRILYAGNRTGYVSRAYLKGAEAYPAVSLSVPCYRQWDSRWGWMKVGASGKTLSSIGCATTGISMIESYRTGAALTPAVMVKRLSYTASGNVYWPSDYTPHFYREGYLADIYRELQKGHPVLIGAKTAAGGQHWVVVTGYTGGSTLTAAGFTIHDPGVSSRRTLANYFAAYPIFYKYFTY